MKRLVIVTEGMNTGITLKNQLTALLGKYIKIDNKLLSELESLNDSDIDLILYSSSYVKNRSLRYIDSKIPNIIAKRIIDHKNIKEVISIEEGKDVLFINDGYESTKEAIESLLELGLDHIKYHPYYPDCTSYPKLEIAITAGESQLAPYKPKMLIDIGTRILDIQTIHEIISILNLESKLGNGLVVDYIRDIVKISKSIDESRRKSQEDQQILEIVVNTLDYGIAFIDNYGKITNLNTKFEYIIGVKRKNIIGKKLEELLPFNYDNLDENKVFIAEIENREITFEVREVEFSKKIGYILWVKHNPRSSPKTNYDNNRIISRNLHTFKDYYTINKKALKLLNKAEKFSLTDANILIQGENGTGKEILAQGIHMNSFRKNNIFVPINMTTISANLLESELFGYEEGTFTGALKGGKIGLFEMADGGTVFIDEIGDTPLEVQAKLLRVLEEKRIRRVGGIEEIPIDVRIIAATNKNLLDLVKQNKFRLDLFFRLNILPLQTIPLRERREDIEYLLKYFINLNSKDKKIESLEEFFEDETLDFLINYKWIGNIRELINLVEYLMLIYDGQKFGINSLHNYMLEVQDEKKPIYLSEDQIWVLKQFFYHDKFPLGRVKITEMASNEKVEIGEGKIRSIIKELINYGFIEQIGTLGSRITKSGRAFMKEI
ncbi:MAG: sigma 54-interacting transcriptional regulator [Tissierellaceae bacterium]|nr:sigma 54-interacting transcriptional regulator [Tissierellaceae bacterium]